MSYDAEQYAYGTERAWALLTEEQERIEALAELNPPTYSRAGHDWGNRNKWRYVDPTNPWSELVNRDGYTPGGECLFPKGKAA
jgi:hypothetical protein